MIDQAIDAVDEYTAKNIGKFGAGVFVGIGFWGADKIGLTDFQEYDSFKRDVAHTGGYGLLGNDIAQLIGGDGVLEALSDDPMVLAGLTTVTGGRAALHRHKQNRAAAVTEYRQAVKDWKAKYGRAEGAHIVETSETDPRRQASIMSVDEAAFRDLYDRITDEHAAEVTYTGDRLEREAYDEALDEALEENEDVMDQLFLEWGETEGGTAYRTFALGREGPIGNKVRRKEPLLEAQTTIEDRRIDDPIAEYMAAAIDKDVATEVETV